MNNDIIKLLYLESYNIDLDKSILIKNGNGIEYVIVLNKADVSCPKCGCIECTIHDYRIKSIKHSLFGWQKVHFRIGNGPILRPPVTEEAF